jgi:hypothetical protein
VDDIPLLIDFATPSSIFREHNRISPLRIIGNGPPGTFMVFPTAFGCRCRRIRSSSPVTKSPGIGASRTGWSSRFGARADCVDVTRGVLTSGTPRTRVAQLYGKRPDAGFHRRLIQLELGHLRKHPLNPLPVFRL